MVGEREGNTSEFLLGGSAVQSGHVATVLF